MSAAATDGTAGVGSPRGTGPTTSTPLAARSSAFETARPATRTSNAHGTLRANLGPPNRMSSETSERTTVVRSA